MAEQTEGTRTSVKRIVDRQHRSKLPELDMGKLPPQALEFEASVIGAMLLDKDAVTTVIEILKAESFYSSQHQIIFEAIIKLFEESKPVDLLTVTEKLRNNGKLDEAGGPYYLTELTNRVGSSSHVEFHARIIAEKYIMRELIRISNQVIKDAYDETTDVFDLLDRAEQDLFGITENHLKSSYDSMGSLLTKAINELEKLGQQEEQITGVPSGFASLDAVTSGWQRSDLVIVAARPGMGKTSFTLSLARNAAVMYKKPVAFFSLEMSSLQLVNRLISSETELQSDKLRKGNLKPWEWQQLTSKAQHLAEAPLFIDDTPGINIFELRAKCRRLKMQHDIQLIIIDYLQLMSGSMGENKNSNREQEISTISRSLKSIAKELNVPIIALSQLNRSVETRGGDKRPQLSDLRESGAIEQDADMVTFIYRPEYYQILQDETGESTEGLAEIIIAKHRNGALDTVKLRFVSKFTRFEDRMAGVPYAGDVPPGDSGNVITRPSKINGDQDGDHQGMGDDQENQNNDLPF